MKILLLYLITACLGVSKFNYWVVLFLLLLLYNQSSWLLSILGGVNTTTLIFLNKTTILKLWLMRIPFLSCLGTVCNLSVSEPSMASASARYNRVMNNRRSTFTYLCPRVFGTCQFHRSLLTFWVWSCFADSY